MSFSDSAASMNDALVLSVDHVTKAYRIWDSPSSRLIAPLQESLAGIVSRSSLSQWLHRRASSHYRDFFALRDVSLNVRRGESIGIIGRNGSGKSTLLQIIAGTTRPTVGTAETKGRVAALLELGSGFNPEFTGRENVYLNAAVLGMSREAIDARYETIVAFSEIGEFIEQPVKTYSSGMVMRLAFAVASHVDPDILIIDEALSVGDARFQLKCARAIDRFVAQGVTLLFVSHDVSSIKRLCSRAILLEKGRVVSEGVPNDVTNLYSKLIAEEVMPETPASNPPRTRLPVAPPAPSTPISPVPTPHRTAPPGAILPAHSAPKDSAALQLRLKAIETILQAHPADAVLERKIDALLQSEPQDIPVSGSEFAYGGSAGKILDIEVADTDGQLRTWFTTGESVTVRCRIVAHDDFLEPIFALTIKNTAGVEVYGTNTLFSNQPAPAISSGEHRQIHFSFPINLMAGTYFLSFGFTHFIGEQIVVVHRRYDALKIEVHEKDRTFGIANLHAKIEVLPAAS